MRTIIRFAGFMSVFFFGFLAVNYFIFYGIASLFSIKPGYIFYSLLIIAVISYPLAAMIERVVSNTANKNFLYRGICMDGNIILPSDFHSNLLVDIIGL